MIQVSETAKKRVVNLMTEEGYDATKDYVRVGVKSGGCCGGFLAPLNPVRAYIPFAYQGCCFVAALSPQIKATIG